MQTDTQNAPASPLGATLDALAHTIAQRRTATEESYTHRLLEGKLDSLLKKVSEESLETCLAAKETDLLVADASAAQTAQAAQAAQASQDHLRYEAADLVYHLMVLLARFDISNDDLAAELNARMTPEERPEGARVMDQNHINRGR